MIQGNVRFEDGKFGTRAILTAPWSLRAHQEIMRVRPNELELNTSKGWGGHHIDFIEQYEWLLSFIIIDMNIDNIISLCKLKSLINLDIVTYCNTKIDFTAFQDLKSCSLEWRSGSESLFECVNLTDLFVNRYKGKSSSPFGNLVNLESLAILNSSISELRGLTKLHRLRSLRLGGLRSLKSLNGIEELYRLEKFEMQICRSVKSLSPLSGLRSLIEVNVSSNGKLESLDPLRGMPHLQTVLFYDSTNITDGDLLFLFENPCISNISFQNRRHYSHNRDDFNQRSQDEQC